MWKQIKSLCPWTVNKPAHYRCASIAGNYLRCVSYSCLMLMGKWLEGGKAGREQSVWCLLEDWRKAFCLPGGHGISGHTAQQAAPWVPQRVVYEAAPSWPNSFAKRVSARSGEAFCYLSSQNARFKYAHHRSEHSSHVGDGEWGCRVNRLTNHPFLLRGIHHPCPLSKKRHWIPPHTNCKFLWNHPFETELRYVKHNWQKFKPRGILERPSESLSGL